MNTLITKIEKLDNLGRGITYYNNKIMFVNGALKDEKVLVGNIIEEKKFYLATVIEVMEPSKTRVIPKCPYYDLCGGCNLQHMCHDESEKYKLNKVKEILKKYAKLDIPIKFVSSDKFMFYRNKISLKIENGLIGYYNEKSHTLIPIDTCLLAKKPINDIIPYLKTLNINNGEVIIRCNYENKILLSIISDDKITLNNVLDNIEGIILNDKTIYNNSYFYDYIGDEKFKISYNSFFQVNNYIANAIFEILKNNLKGKNVLDLYCGVGTLGIAVKDNFKKIYGIEKVVNATHDAKENAIINNVSNALYFSGNASIVLKGLNTSFDTVIIDPPRSGLNKETLDSILDINPDTICYISCDPFSLARDLNILKEQYKVNKITVLDMFPNTTHVETVCLLKKL